MSLKEFMIIHLKPQSITNNISTRMLLVTLNFVVSSLEIFSHDDLE